MLWENIVGHQETLSMLRRLVASDRVPHAMLFIGATGVGKGLVARTLAAAMLCQASDNKPCGVCLACRRIDGGSHPDLFSFEANGETIKIEQIREMQSAVALSPVHGGRRIVILEDADRMTLPAANSLLKILEEPSHSMLFILTSSSLQSLLSTIVSRCRLVRLAPAAPQLLTAALVAKGHLPETAEVAARLSGGRMGRALMLVQPDGLAARNKAVEILRRLPDSKTLSGWNDVIELDGNATAQIPDIVEQLLFLLRDALLIKKGFDCRLLYNSDIIEQLKAFALTWSEPDIQSAVKATMSTARALTGNANARLLSEALLLRLGEFHTVS